MHDVHLMEKTDAGAATMAMAIRDMSDLASMSGCGTVGHPVLTRGKSSAFTAASTWPYLFYVGILS